MFCSLQPQGYAAQLYCPVSGLICPSQPHCSLQQHLHAVWPHGAQCRVWKQTVILSSNAAVFVHSSQCYVLLVQLTWLC